MRFDAARLLAAQIGPGERVEVVRRELVVGGSSPTQLSAADAAVRRAADALAREFQFPYPQLFIQWLVSGHPPGTDELLKVMNNPIPTEFGCIQTLGSVRVEVHDPTGDAPAALKLSVTRETTFEEVKHAWRQVRRLQRETFGPPARQRVRNPVDITMLKTIARHVNAGSSLVSAIHKWNFKNPTQLYGGDDAVLRRRLKRHGLI
ncbi:MAG: hypothetical protein IT301_01540 [Dehalococcoidia bacterium]|nr:hypothetical protein [Dehalococcoidia bacterium]